VIFQVVCGERRICSRCLYEDKLAFRMKGLLGREGLDGEEGILLKPCNSIHMFFMAFAIDAVFLDKDNRILRIYHSIKPWRISGLHFKAVAVVELAAGVAERHSLQAGEILEFRAVQSG